MSEWLGVELWPHKRRPTRRHVTSHYAVLTGQKRSESGFKFAVGGVERCAPAVGASLPVGALPQAAVPVVPTAVEQAAAERSAAPTRAERLLAALQDLADRGAMLPPLHELGLAIGIPPCANALTTRVDQLLKMLHARQCITMVVERGHPRRYPLPRTVHLADGRVLRNRTAA